MTDGASTQLGVRLDKIVNGILHDYVLVLDPRWGGTERGVQVIDSLFAVDLNVSCSCRIREKSR